MSHASLCQLCYVRDVLTVNAHTRFSGCWYLEWTCVIGKTVDAVLQMPEGQYAVKRGATVHRNERNLDSNTLHLALWLNRYTFKTYRNGLGSSSGGRGWSSRGNY